MIYAQLSLAKAGFSTGGRPPGFNGSVMVAVRQLPRVNMSDGGPSRRLAASRGLDFVLIRRILEMLQTLQTVSPPS